MNNFTFYSPTEFVFGKDTEKKTGELIKKYATIYFIVPMVLYNYWFIQTQKAHPTDAL